MKTKYVRVKRLKDSAESKSMNHSKRAISFKEACSRYVHRFTMEHVPDWSRIPMKNGEFYAPQYRTCREWYDNTAFHGESMHASRKNCYSTNLSWPLGRMLKEVYTKKK